MAAIVPVTTSMPVSAAANWPVTVKVLIELLITLGTVNAHAPLPGAQLVQFTVVLPLMALKPKPLVPFNVKLVFATLFCS